jgi:hypothetical protein
MEKLILLNVYPMLLGLNDLLQQVYLSVKYKYLFWLIKC